MDDAEVKQRLRTMLFHHAARWCEPGPQGCACLGCANVSGGLMKAGVTKEQWARCMNTAFREFME